MNLEHLKTLLEKAGIECSMPCGEIIQLHLPGPRYLCLSQQAGCSWFDENNCMTIARSVWDDPVYKGNDVYFIGDGEHVYLVRHLTMTDGVLAGRLNAHCKVLGSGPTWEAALVSALERKVEEL